MIGSNVKKTHFNISRHVRPTALDRLIRGIAKRLRSWRQVKNGSLALRRLSDAIALDRAEIYDPLYEAKRDRYERRDSHVEFLEESGDTI